MYNVFANLTDHNDLLYGKESLMKSIDNYLSELKKYLPDVEERLNSGTDTNTIRKSEDEVKCKFPSEFIELYSRMNGEDSSEYTGFIAGFEFMPLEKVVSETHFFQSLGEEMMAIGTDAIKEEPIYNLAWIPFAFDCSRAYIVIDLTPTETGKTGQIITVDLENNNCYLLAENMDDLFGKMTVWLQQGILLVDKENESPFITEQSGHLFNSLDELTMLKGIEEEKFVPLPAGYWEEYYKNVRKNNRDGSYSVSINCLAKEKSMLIKDKHLSCELLAYMENLKELIFHDCEIDNIRFIAQAPQLQKLIFAGCTFKGEDLSAICGAPKLKEISINGMAGDGLSLLKEIKTLKSLSIRKVTGIDEKTLAGFVKLQELSIEDVDIHDGTFIGNIKNLKKLNLNYLHMENLDFLKYLTKLVEFELNIPAANEDGLDAVRSIRTLKSFIYPVKNLDIYKGHPCLKVVGMDSGVKRGFEVFADSQVDSFEICGKVSGRHMDKIRKKMERYVHLSSYGYRDAYIRNRRFGTNS